MDFGRRNAHKEDRQWKTLSVFLFGDIVVAWHGDRDGDGNLEDYEVGNLSHRLRDNHCRVSGCPHSPGSQ